MPPAAVARGRRKDFQSKREEREVGKCFVRVHVGQKKSRDGGGRKKWEKKERESRPNSHEMKKEEGGNLFPQSRKK